MNAINVEIYFRIGHDPRTGDVDGYQPGEHLVKVFEYSTAQAGRTIEQVADQAYRIGNGVATGDEDHQLRCAYEGSVLRAVGVGDVVITGGVALACTPTGWRPITLPTITTDEHSCPGPQESPSRLHVQAGAGPAFASPRGDRHGGGRSLVFGQ